jgi:hypothetical protein
MSFHVRNHNEIHFGSLREKWHNILKRKMLNEMAATDVNVSESDS